VSTVCRKAVITNCDDCLFNFATMSPTLLEAENKDLMFGPCNIAYKHHQAHLQLAQLHALFRQPGKSTLNLRYWYAV
jgi:hypothetical protein